jgi:exopolysaccharide production protein ExoY
MRTRRPDIENGFTRVLDLVAAVLGLIFVLPLLVGLWIAIRVEDGGPAFFSQERLGRHGRRFRCLKFRTMAVDADARLAELLARDPQARLEWSLNQKLQDDPRVTRIGAFLRRSSLDELPQLFNVIRGEMSLVGPRPIVAAELIRYGVHIRHYYAVRPGLTGLWQVSGRNDVSYRRRVVMDVAYVRSHGLMANLEILAKTVPVVLLRRGAY